MSNKNYEWMFFIKRKVTNILALNIFIAIVYVVFYLSNGFYIVDIKKQNLFVIILFGINGIIEQLGIFMKNSEMTIFKDNNSINAVYMGTAVSFICFIFMYLFTHSMAGVVLVIYLTYYYIFFKFYPRVKNSDMKVIDMHSLLMTDDEEQNNENENIDTPNTSFNRVDPNL